MKTLFGILSLLLTIACSAPKNITYFSNAEHFVQQDVMYSYDNKIQKDDVLSIVVGSKNPELVVPFNQTIVSRNPANPNANQVTLVTYLVDLNNDIIFPIIGKIKVEGLSHSELAKLIEQKIIEGEYVNDPTVTVKLTNYKISVMGEVNKPGVQHINSDRVTIYEALSLAGDLTISGLRENISVIREQDGKRTIAQVDISSKEIFESPYYYLRPNDVVYVEPNDRKKKSSTRNPAVVSSVLSGLSLIVSLANLIFN